MARRQRRQTGWRRGFSVYSQSQSKRTDWKKSVIRMQVNSVISAAKQHGGRWGCLLLRSCWAIMCGTSVMKMSQVYRVYKSNTSRRVPKVHLSQTRILLYVQPQKVSRFALCCPRGWISFKQSHCVGAVIAPLREVLPHGYTFLRLDFLQSWQLYFSSDWTIAVRSSWPFRWSPCGPIRLAGLHSVKHESVRHRKAASLPENVKQ